MTEAILTVMVHDVWDRIILPYRPEMIVNDLKVEGLTAARVTADPGQYAIKYLGAELRDESLNLESAGVVPGASLVIVHRRRQAVL